MQEAEKEKEVQKEESVEKMPKDVQQMWWFRYIPELVAKFILVSFLL